MRFAYLILAHDGFDQLSRLIDRLLLDNDDLVYLHVDAKVSIPHNFRIPPRAMLLTRAVKVYWAHWSQCAATLRLLDAALAGSADYFHLLSGKDWPVKTRQQMVDDIIASGDRDCFLTIREENYDWRMDNWCFEDRFHSLARNNGPAVWRLAVAIRRFSRRFARVAQHFGFRRSRPLGDWAVGWQWWTLPLDAALFARDALQRLLDSGRLEFTQCSDEHVVQTALANSAFHARLSGNRRFVSWDGGASPRTLTGADLSALRETNAWFARKVSEEVDDFFYTLPAYRAPQ